MDTENRGRVLFVCFPDAGESAGWYRTWRDPRIAVHAVELPGRGERRGEHPYRDMWLLVEALTTELAGVLARPHVLFGVGLGALLAYRVAARRVHAGMPAPQALTIAHQAPPGVSARPRIVPDQVQRDELNLLASDEHLPAAPPLPCPIRAFGEPELMAGWRALSSADFVLTPARAQDRAALLRDAVLRSAYLISALAAQSGLPPMPEVNVADA